MWSQTARLHCATRPCGTTTGSCSTRCCPGAAGEAALRGAAVGACDGIVPDVTLRGRGGFEVCRALRERDCWAPVLLLTARGRVGDGIRGLDAGAGDCLPKPFDFGELLARLR